MSTILRQAKTEVLQDLTYEFLGYFIVLQEVVIFLLY